MATLFLSGPRLILIRAVLRRFGPASQVRVLAPRVALYITGALLLLWIGIAVTLGPQAGFTFTIVTTLGALALMDFAWRWLPLEWMIALAVSGLVVAIAGESWAISLQASLVGAALLGIPRAVLQYLRGYEVMGLGDVILAAAIGLHTDLLTLVWALTAASISALISHAILNFLSSTTKFKRLGVPFGAHIAVVFAILYSI